LTATTVHTKSHTYSRQSTSTAKPGLAFASQIGLASAPIKLHSTNRGASIVDYQLLMVGPNQEAAVSRTLDQLGLVHEWFRQKRRVIYRGRLIHRIMPIFPGYIFVIARYLWSLIEKITGVRGFVRFGGQIETVPERVVMSLREQVDARGILAEGALPFAPGDRVLVRVGGQETAGIFKDYAGPAKAIVDVRMLGRMCSATVRLGDVKCLR